MTRGRDKETGIGVLIFCSLVIKPSLYVNILNNVMRDTQKAADAFIRYCVLMLLLLWLPDEMLHIYFQRQY